MKFSQKILSRNLVFPQFEVKSAETLVHRFEIIDGEVEVFFKVDKESIQFLGVKGELSHPYHLIFDALLELASNRPIGSLNRISSKELDNFLRDEPQKPAVSYYNSQYLDLFSFTSALYQKLSGVKQTGLEKSENFFDLSFSEQVEFFEEVLAEEFYPQIKWESVGFDLVDCGESNLEIETSNNFSSDEQAEIFNKIKKFIPKLIRINWV